MSKEDAANVLDGANVAAFPGSVFSQDLIDEVNEKHLLQANLEVEGQYFKLNSDGSALSELKTCAVHPTQFSKQLSFANSLLGPSVNYEPPKITWEDDEPISENIWSEIRTLFAEHTVDINWENNDVVVIDNTRWMHGRRKLLDLNRKIYGGQSYLTDQYKKMEIAA